MCTPVIPDGIDRKEWLKLLHVKGDPKQRLVKQMDEAEAELLKAAQPRWTYRVIEKSSVPTEGISIEKHLEECDQVVAIAVTIGPEIDNRIFAAQESSMSMAIVMDTGASVLAEQTADLLEQIILSEVRKEYPELFFTSRFSPGYGDYPVRLQRELLAEIDPEGQTGITLTSGNMMIPHKSITAIIGMSDHPVSGRLATCQECVLQGKCSFLKGGRHC